MTKLTPVRVVQVIPVVAEIYGGASTVALEVNRQLRSLNVDAELITTTLNGEPGTTMSDLEVDQINSGGSYVTLCKPSWPCSLQNSWQLWFDVFRKVRNADHVHIDGQYRLPGVYAYCAARLWRKPYSIQTHGALDDVHRTTARAPKWIYNLLVGKRILRHAEQIIFTSDAEAAAAREFIPSGRGIVLPLGAALPPADVIAGLQEQTSESSREELVLYLGRLTVVKQPSLLIQAWAKCARSPQSKLIIAGPDGEVTQQELRILSESLGVEDSVIFAGQVSGGNKTWLYERCGTFVLASVSENFGLTVAEAMLAGCHVISGTGVGASRFLPMSRSGHVVTDLTTEGLARALSEALSDSGALRASGFRAKEFAAQHLTWEPLARRVRDIAMQGPPYQRRINRHESGVSP